MKTVHASGITTTGVDLSSWDPLVNWAMLKAGGCALIVLKATEGITLQDKSFGINWPAAKINKVIRGAYHFFHPSDDPIAQAKNFCSVVGSLDPDDLPPIIDWEATDNQPAQIDLAKGLQFLEYVEKFFGKTPICYGGPYFLQALNMSAEFARYPLWVAHYTTGAPLVPAPWTTWSIWQYTDVGAVPGVGAAGHGKCDANLFNGSLAELQAFIAKSNLIVAPAPTVVEAKAVPKPKKEA